MRMSWMRVGGVSLPGCLVNGSWDAALSTPGNYFGTDSMSRADLLRLYWELLVSWFR